MSLAKEKFEYAFFKKTVVNLIFYQNVFHNLLEISLDQRFLVYWWKPVPKV